MDFLAVAIAGFLGAVTRAALGEGINMLLPWKFPLGTLIPNLTGCFLLSLFMDLAMDRLQISQRLRVAVGTGFLGAYTTFSTFTVESLNLIENRLALQAAAYILLTPAGCVLMALWGHNLSKSMAGKGGFVKRERAGELGTGEIHELDPGDERE